MQTRDLIPSSDNLKELAEFWQTHSMTEYEDQLEEGPGPLLVRKSVKCAHPEPDTDRREQP